MIILSISGGGGDGCDLSGKLAASKGEFIKYIMIILSISGGGGDGCDLSGKLAASKGGLQFAFLFRLLYGAEHHRAVKLESAPWRWGAAPVVARILRRLRKGQAHKAGQCREEA
jgi:hypothetical protein